MLAPRSPKLAGLSQNWLKQATGWNNVPSEPTQKVRFFDAKGVTLYMRRRTFPTYIGVRSSGEKVRLCHLETMKSYLGYAWTNKPAELTIAQTVLWEIARSCRLILMPMARTPIAESEVVDACGSLLVLFPSA